MTFSLSVGMKIKQSKLGGIYKGTHDKVLNIGTANSFTATVVKRQLLKHFRSPFAVSPFPQLPVSHF